MTLLPRNKIARRDNTIKKHGHKREIANNDKILEELYIKHNIGPLEFRESKLIDQFGKVTDVDNIEIRGNMRASFLLMRYSNLHYQPEGIYDLFLLAYDKKLRENKKKVDDIQSAIKNFDLDKEDPFKMDSDQMVNAEEPEIKHEESVNKNDEEPEIKHEETINKNDEEPTNKNIEEPEIKNEESVKSHHDEPTNNHNAEPKMKSITTSSDPDKLSNPKLERKRQELIQKRNKIVNTMRSEYEKKMNASQRNKYHRHLMMDIMGKLGSVITELPDYKYIEVTKNSTKFVIENADVFRIDIGSKYLLIVGDLNFKKEIAKKIDPAYESEKMTDEYEDFLEKIQKQEANEKQNENQSDILIEQDNDDENLDDPPEAVPTGSISMEY